jgi:hypothetical protein
MGAAAVRRAILIISAVLALALPGAARASSPERVYIPSLMLRSCTELCGYCLTISELDHVMGCGL